MAEKIRLTKTGITAPMYCELAAVDYWVNERGWVIDPSDQTPGPPGSQPVTRDELAAFGIATGKTAVAIPTGTTAAVGNLLAVSPFGFETAPPGGRFTGYGSNFTLGDPSGSLTSTQITTAVQNMVTQFGPRPVLLVFHVAYEAGTLKIAQHGFGATGHSEAKVDEAVAQLTAAGIPIYGIKVHQSGITSGQVTSQFWTDYTALINQLATKYQGTGVDFFFVTNEFEAATGNSANLAALNGLVTAVRGKGYQAGVVYNSLVEAARCVVTDLDGIAVNVYPSVSTRGLKTTWQQVAAAWEGYGVSEYFRYVKDTYPGRKCFIGETGCLDKATALEYTPKWNFGADPDNGGVIVGRYWEGTLRYLAGEGGDSVDAAFDWFDPLSFTEARKIITRYAKAATL